MITEARDIRVLVGEDHPLFRAALAKLIEQTDGLELVCAVSDGEEAYACVLELRPDVAVLDVRMPRLPGDELMARLAQLDFAPRVLFVSEFVSGDIVLEVLTAGAAGYLSKTADEDTIIDAIRRVAAQETVLPAEIGADLARALHARRVDSPVLTGRELSIITMLAEGLSAIEIGERLHLAVSTVRGHMHDLYRKLDAEDRGAAVATAIRRGLIS